MSHSRWCWWKSDDGLGGQCPGSDLRPVIAPPGRWVAGLSVTASATSIFGPGGKRSDAGAGDVGHPRAQLDPEVRGAVREVQASRPVPQPISMTEWASLRSRCAGRSSIEVPSNGALPDTFYWTRPPARLTAKPGDGSHVDAAEWRVRGSRSSRQATNLAARGHRRIDRPRRCGRRPDYG
jgi:hypothetical protein